MVDADHGFHMFRFIFQQAQEYYQRRCQAKGCLLRVLVVLMTAAVLSHVTQVPAQPPADPPPADAKESDWNSLEIAKLLVSGATPLLVLLMGWIINHRLKAMEHRQWTSQRAIDKRLEVFENLVPELNDLLCFYTRIGNWKEHSPVDIVARKRSLDKKANIYAPLFSSSFIKEYNNFMNLCYRTYAGHGVDAKLRTSAKRYREANSAWQVHWDDFFDAEDYPSKDDVRQAYDTLTRHIVAEVRIDLASETGTAGRRFFYRPRKRPPPTQPDGALE
jgi:hypothetical protein